MRWRASSPQVDGALLCKLQRLRRQKQADRFSEKKKSTIARRYTCRRRLVVPARPALAHLLRSACGHCVASLAGRLARPHRSMGWLVGRSIVAGDDGDQPGNPLARRGGGCGSIGAFGPAAGDAGRGLASGRPFSCVVVIMRGALLRGEFLCAVTRACTS